MCVQVVIDCHCAQKSCVRSDANLYAFLCKLVQDFQRKEGGACADADLPDVIIQIWI